MVLDFWSSLLSLLLVYATTQLIISIVKHVIVKNKRLPPGPSPLPIVGNLFDLGAKPHQSLAKLAKIHGPIFSLRIGSKTTVVVSSPSVAKEVLQKSDVLFSNRNVPDSVTAHHHHAHSVVLLPSSSPLWKSLRKICVTQVFANSRLELTQNLRKKKVVQLLSYVDECSRAGKAINVGHVGFTAMINLLSNTFFSVDLVDPSNSPNNNTGEFKDLVWAMMVEAGKPNISDFFPMLKMFDPQGSKRRMTGLMEKLLKVFNSLVQERLEMRKSSDYVEKNDVLDTLLSIYVGKTEQIDLTTMTHLLFDLFGAGTDTTSSTLEWAMAELLCNPEKLKKAQKELEEVIGLGNPVEETNIAQLTYLSAVIKEVLRKHPPTPLLVPRKVDEDVELSGFVVPKGAQVFVNVWAMGRDPDVWEDAHVFNPERFMESKIDYRGRDFEFLPFGSGRRICPGISLAHRMLHWMLGSLIHSFDWKLGDGKTPENLDMDDKFGFTVQRAQSLLAIPLPRSR
ncbi:hypothetical protein Dimus_008824 [Dionaea muscipula]